MLFLAVLVAGNWPASAAVPLLMNYQGRVAVSGTPFTGLGQFRFAVVHRPDGSTLWSNDGTSVAGSEPADSVIIPVTNGVFTVLLGDTDLINMQPLPSSIFTSHGDVSLRVWFDDGANGSHAVQPDQRLGSVPFALAATLPENSVTLDKISASAPPATGQVLAYDGAGLSWITPAGGPGGTLALPYSGVASANSALFSIHNNGLTDSWAIFGRSVNNLGVFGQTLAEAQAGVLGRNDGATGAGGAGVFGYAPNQAVGVLAISEGGDGLSARSNADGKSAVFGYTARHLARAGSFRNESAGTALYAESSGGTGVEGFSSAGWGMFGRGANNIGVFGQTLADGEAGVLGRNDGVTGINGAGVYGYAPNLAAGVLAISDGGDGLSARSNADGKSAVFGYTARALGWGGFFMNAGGGVALHSEGRLEVVGDANIQGTATVRVLTITGGADLAEPFPLKEERVEKGAVVVIDDEHVGRLKLATTAYDTRVAGIVSGANGINPGISLHQEGRLEGSDDVALSGRVYVRADARFGAIRPGDLLTTSDTPGHAMKVRDPVRAQGAILGKAMSRLDEGTGLVLVLVTLQ